MAGGYGSGLSRSGNSSTSRPRSRGGGYGTGLSRAAVTPKKEEDDGGFSIGGFVGNLAGDVRDTVTGLGPSVVKIGAGLGHDTAAVAGRLPGASRYAKRARREGFQSDDVAKAVAESYRYQYGPLFRGDVGTFSRRFYEHPLGPLLDATAVLSVGSTAALRAGLAPAAVKRGFIELRTPSGAIVRKPLPRQTLRAEIQTGVQSGLNRLPGEFPVVGEGARAARQLQKAPHRLARSRELLEEPFLRALGKVRNQPQRLAAFWISQVPHPDDLGRIVKMLEEDGSSTALATAKLLRDPKFVQAYMHPTERMGRVLDGASQVAEAQRAVLGIADDVARHRAYMPTLLARGAHFEPDETGRAFLSPPPPGPSTVQKTSRPRTLPEAEARLDELRAWETETTKKVEQYLDIDPREIQRSQHINRAREQAQRVVRNKNVQRTKEGVHPATYRAAYGGGSYQERLLDYKQGKFREKIEELAAKRPDDPDLARAQAQLKEMDDLKLAIQVHREHGTPFEGMTRYEGEGLPPLGDVVEKQLIPAPGFGSIDDMIRQIDADLEAAGRPKPVYMPHTSEAPVAGHVYGAGGVGPQVSPGPLRQTLGILLGRGQLIQDPMVLRSSFVKSVKFALYKDIHALHVEHGRKIPLNEPVPKGWQVVRRRQGERTPYTIKTGSEFEDFAKGFLDEDATYTFRDNPFLAGSKADQLTVTDDVLDAMGMPAKQEFRVIVPKEFSRQLAGEFVRSGRFLNLMNKYPVRVWRHLVLKLRPAWLVNNIVGNALLYLVHSADPQALRSLGETFKRLTPKRQRDAFDELMRVHFPEQIHGTFIGSQLPVFRYGSKGEKLERVTSYVGAGIAHVDRIWEQGLRSAVVRAELRKSPELRSLAGKMRKQTDEFWKLADEELTRNPLLAEKINAKAMDALGDFLALGRVERDLIRAAFPFYAWYRVITLITLKLPFTHPLKAPLLARLGQVGATSALEELGIEDENAIDLARGFFSLGEDGDRIRGIPTTSANPFATVAQMQVFAAALAGGEPGDAWAVMPGVNPLFGIPIEVVTGAKARSGYKGNNRFGILSSAPTRFFESLPEVRLAKALSGKSYQGTPDSPTLYDRDRYDELLRYLGVPYARVSPERIEEIGTGH